jgi:thiol-disulfide isomerase/thioredoxin
MPDFQEFYEEHRDEVTLVGIDVGQFTGLGDQNAAKALLKELGVTYPAGFTDDGGVMRDYKVLAMPTTVFIRSNGELFRTWGGVLNSQKLTEVTNDMLEQEPNTSG